MIPCIASLRRCRSRASTINGTTRRGKPMPTCTLRRKACMIFCAPIIILSSQERGLERQPALSAEILDRERVGKIADLLCDGFCEEHGRNGSGGDAIGGRDR